MKISTKQKIIRPIRNIASNPRVSEFAKTTVCAIAVETSLKAAGRPVFIYHDKHANKQSKKYAATKEFIYQNFCLGLYLSCIKPIQKRVYKVMSKKIASRSPEDKRKIDLYDTYQKKIANAKSKAAKKNLETRFSNLLHKNSDYHLGKGTKELSSIVSTVFILALCAPIASQIILHPVMNLIFHKKGNEKK